MANQILEARSLGHPPAAAIGTHALNDATKAFKSSVPNLDWAGGFATGQLVKNVLANAPICWGQSARLRDLDC
jgi:hypothetical protein